MDAAALKAALDAAREFDFSLDGIALRLRIPTQSQLDISIAESMLDLDEGAPMQMVRLQPILMRRCVIGWTGPNMRDIGANLPDLPLPYAAALADEVFDRWPQLYNKAFGELLTRFTDFKARAEVEAKN